jgi:geranylgeranyl diphosphate synthase type II
MDTPSSTPAHDRAALRSRIEAALDRYTDWSASDCPVELREALRYSLLAPGKRLRPTLVLLAAEACGGDLLAALPPACAVEMVHAYSLIHDDLPAMDDDDLRRGRPTCHKQFGEAIAILAGDALLALAFQVVAEEVKPAQIAAQCCAALAEAAGPCNLVGGQAEDILGKLASIADSSDPVAAQRALEQLESIHHRKTGAMIRVSLRLGALVAGADAAQLAALERFGHCLGLAFQITDDLLDVCGNEAEVGKRVRKDSAQGKLTFPGLLGVDRSAQRAEELVREACAAIQPLGLQASGLDAIARYVLERQH